MRAKGVYVALAGLVCALPVLGLGEAEGEQSERYGVFSNIEAVEGEYSGFQFILLPSNEGDFVVFQQAEGWPQRPLLLELEREATPTATVRFPVFFEHPAMGRFEGGIHGDTLVGEFTRIKYEIVLVRGELVW